MQSCRTRFCSVLCVAKDEGVSRSHGELGRGHRSGEGHSTVTMTSTSQTASSVHEVLKYTSWSTGP